MRGMLIASLLLAVGGLATPMAAKAHSSITPPGIREGESYFEVRERLRAAGWHVTDYAVKGDRFKGEILHDTPEGAKLDEELRSGLVKLGLPEFGACFPTGLGQCFAIWRKGTRLLVVELMTDPKVDTHVYFFYQARLHRSLDHGRRPTRDAWDPRTADIIPGSHPPWRRECPADC